MADPPHHKDGILHAVEIIGPPRRSSDEKNGETDTPLDRKMSSTKDKAGDTLKKNVINNEDER